MDNNHKIYRKRFNNYLNGKLTLKHNLDIVNISNGLDWNYKHKYNDNTYQVYLHGLNFVKDFIELYRIEENTKSIKEARKIILDWFKVNNKNNHKNLSWNEHAVSTRLNNIIYFQEYSGKYNLSKNIFKKIINSHCNFLDSEKYYKMNNHGLMMDHALLNASNHIENDELKQQYIEKVLLRIKLSMLRNFSFSGVHSENSPEYHLMTLVIYDKIFNLLNEKDIKIEKEYHSIFKQAKSFRNIMIKPDSTYPMIGDTGKTFNKNIKKNFLSFIDYEAGIGILKFKNRVDITKSPFLSFKSGYRSLTHKHFDDLSFTYSVNGHDLFIDSGKYSYNKHDPIREFIISPAAHNTIYLKNDMYTLNDPIIDKPKLKLTKYYSGPNFKVISGINFLYKNVQIHRTIIITLTLSVIIVDRVISKEPKSIIQNFTLNERVKIQRKSKTDYQLKLNEYKYKLTQHINRDNINSNISRGYVSYNFGKYIENERIVFENLGSDSLNFQFVTSITPETSEINNVILKTNKISFKINNGEYNIYL